MRIRLLKISALILLEALLLLALCWFWGCPYPVAVISTLLAVSLTLGPLLTIVGENIIEDFVKLVILAPLCFMIPMSVKSDFVGLMGLAALFGCTNAILMNQILNAYWDERRSGQQSDSG